MQSVRLVAIAVLGVACAVFAQSPDDPVILPPETLNTPVQTVPAGGRCVYNSLPYAKAEINDFVTLGIDTSAPPALSFSAYVQDDNLVHVRICHSGGRRQRFTIPALKFSVVVIKNRDS